MMENFFILLLASTGSCPKPEEIAPSCICNDRFDGPMMRCSNLVNAEELIPPIKATDGHRMFSLAIMDSSLLYIPNKIFHNTNYKKILFANSQIMSLSDGDLAFEGLEDHLEDLRATDAHYIATWDWQQLKNHRRLQLIDVHHISMYSLDNEFPAWTSLKTLGISNAEIYFIHPTAFRELINLELLVLKNNELTQLSRSMLPQPADHLHTLVLSGNQLTSLPEDMFTGMPNLKDLDLNENKFTTLDEDVFKQPFQTLQTLLLKGNKFRCDCRIRWIVNSRRPLYFEATCDLPEALSGASLRFLNNNQLWCF